jgi:hypothetical protein
MDWLHKDGLGKQENWLCSFLIVSQYGVWEIKPMDGFLILHKGTDKNHLIMGPDEGNLY